MDIGQSACLLLVYIAHTEDAARYSGPVRFWNEQLMTTLGYRSPKQLNAARDAAIKDGWLVYDRKHTRAVGRYFVTIPEQFEDLTDTIIEDTLSAGGTNSGTNSGTRKGARKGRIAERERAQERKEKGIESGKPSYPVPDPVPNPLPYIYTPGNDVRIPQSVNSEVITAAIGRWIAHINNDDTHKNIYPNSPQEEATWRLVASWGESDESTVAAIDAAIAGQWSNLRKPESPRQSNGNGRSQGRGIMDYLDDMIDEESRNEQF
jgi:hypothetical protein